MSITPKAICSGIGAFILVLLLSGCGEDSTVAPAPTAAAQLEAQPAVATAVPTVFPAGRRILVVGTLGPREPTEFLDELVALSPDLVVACTAPSPRAVPAADLAALFRQRRIEVEVVPDAVDAVRLAVAAADESDLVLVTGSFYVLSAARAALSDVVDLDEDGFDA